MASLLTTEALEGAQGLEFLARQAVEGFLTGLHRSPYHGFSVEFAEHRAYQPGESLRHLDWRLYARTDRLYSKQYTEETNLRCQLLVDLSPSMVYPPKGPTKLDFAILAAASLATLLQKQRDAVGLTLFADEIQWQSPIRSTRTHLHQLLAQLEPLRRDPPKAAGETHITQTLHLIAEQLGKRSLVVLFSDLFEANANPDALFGALQHLRHNRHEVLVFHILDRKTEADFDFPERPTLFVDVETGEKLRLTPGDVRKGYLEQIAKFNEDVRLRLGAYGIDVIEVDASAPVRDVLLPYLLKRRRVG